MGVSVWKRWFVIALCCSLSACASTADPSQLATRDDCEQLFETLAALDVAALSRHGRDVDGAVNDAHRERLARALAADAASLEHCQRAVTMAQLECVERSSDLPAARACLARR
jgi:hypothetical protein